MSTFSPIGSLASNCMRMCVCVWTEWTWSTTLAYPHISSYRTMPVLYTQTHLQTIWGYRTDGAKSGYCREIKRTELNLGSRSWVDCLVDELFLNSWSFELCLCDPLPHSCWKSKLRSTQVASHWRGPHLLNIVVLAWLTFFMGRSSGMNCS